MQIDNRTHHALIILFVGVLLIPGVSAQATTRADGQDHKPPVDARVLNPLDGGRDWNDNSPDFSADDRSIVFVSRRDGGVPQLFLLEIESGVITQLTHGPAQNIGPTFSPDGTHIAFTSNRTGTDELHLMKADGTYVRQLTSGGHGGIGERPGWSPDGRQLVFSWGRAGTADLWLMDLETGESRRLTDNLWDETTPDFSPDGTRVVFMSRQGWSPDLFVINADGTGMRQLTDTRPLEWSPAWSPGGERIAFWRGDGVDFQICLMDPDGSNIVELTNAWGRNWTPRWSSDGQWLAFSSRRTGWQGIYMMRADGSDLRKLTGRDLSDFASCVLDEGVDEAFSRLTYSIRALPDESFTTDVECRMLARTLTERGDLAGARRIAEWNVMQHPDSTYASDRMLMVQRAAGEKTPIMAVSELMLLFREGENDKAWTLYHESLEKYPGWWPLSPGWMRVVIDECADRGKLVEARRAAEAGVEAHPQSAMMYGRLARVCHRQGHGDLARRHALRALELDSGDGTAQAVLKALDD